MVLCPRGHARLSYTENMRYFALIALGLLLIVVGRIINHRSANRSRGTREKLDFE
jgi:hypothetical protein